MKNLELIVLSGSAIEEIPSSIEHLVGLKVLDLDNCKNLKKIPEFGEQMKYLELIALSGSAIEEIPSSIGHLVGLKVLHLDNCKNLEKIPEFGEQMKNFAIEEIPSSIGHLVGLVELHLVPDLQQLFFLMALTWSTQRASSSFLSNDLAPGWKYDVFLSFTGVDTRRGFVSHLYHELCKYQGITTFYDDRELERGTSISPELLSAIEASHTAIVVLSPKYAHSKWCLDELTNIVQCMEARKSILPVFYETNPSDIGNQRASFAEAFTEHEEKFISTEDKKKVTQWRSDLKKVSKISGWHSKNFKSERQLIDDIVKYVRRKGTGAIEAISLCLPKVEEVRQWNWEAFSKLHGLRILEFDNLIFSSCPEFLPCSLRTINWRFYPSEFLPTNFQLRFLTQLEMYESKLVRLWEGKMDLPNLKYIDLCDSNKLMSTPDFSSLPNLETLKLTYCKNLVEIHPSIAVLKRLKSLCLDHCHSIKSLPSEFEMDSLEVLSLDDCYNLKKIPKFGEQMKNLESIVLSGSAIEEIRSSIGHLVGLKVLHLRNCKNLKKIPEFGEQMKNLELIDLSGSAIEEIPSSIGHLVGLHDLHLDNCKNLEKILEFGEQMKNLELIVLSGSAIEEIPSSIGHLVGLMELHLYNCKNLKKIPEFGEQMKNLWTLNFSGAGIEDIPSSIGHLVRLKELHLCNCKNLKKIPEFGEQMKNLRGLNLSGSAIEEIPSSIGHLVGLKKLDLHNCKNLKKIPEFGEQMKNLRGLNLSGSAIEEIPSSIGHLVGLKKLDLHNCKNLKKIPEFGEQMKNLRRLNLSGSAIEEIPSSIGQLVGLKYLYLSNCKNPFSNPPRWGLVFSSLTRLCSLRVLYLRDCEFYELDIPGDISCLSFLEILYLSGNNFVSLPESIRCLSKLRHLDLDRCKSLQELPPLPSEGSLRFELFDRSSEIVIPGSEIPGWFSNQSVGHSVNVDLPPPSCTDWLGIAFCVVFQEPKQNLANPPAPPHCDVFNTVIDFCGFRVTYTIGSLMSEHLWMSSSGTVFIRNFGPYGRRVVKAELNAVKKCGARLLYKQDLEELAQTLKILK
ncbi:hypothetical protein DVH24_022084 [Malus domestica]|uniref:TIR domain-containing protein n=1 Tax=Malus domestica TaxID=3750 RepID=A0A498IZS5_MALDO|nr:hypothetical protein DVH24_022084 [Malus domestica]